MDTLDDRVDIARALLSEGITQADLELSPDLAAAPDGAVLAADLALVFPDGLAPVPQPFDTVPSPDAPLPRADVVVITWTVAEQNALCDVFTKGFGRLKWYRYTRNFEEHYRPLIRKGAPSLSARPPRLGSYFPVKLGDLDVLCMKSELHLNQDGVKTGEGTATLPVRDFFQQIIEEVRPRVIATIGTSGSVFADFPLGDVVVTRAAKFRCQKEFRNEQFNEQAFRSDWTLPLDRMEDAQNLMRGFSHRLTEPPLGPPSTRFPFTGPLIEPPDNTPTVRVEQGGQDMPEFHPILTTDYFEYGTSTNGLEHEGAAVEMGDAALGLAIADLTAAGPDHVPDWVVVRNMSDPQINGELPTREFRLNQQTMWAVGYYEAYGYWTSVCGALTTWGLVAGLAEAGPGHA
ncbi:MULTISPECIES: nucleoside phosphorylase-I family protein [Streptomyces]|uniref:Uncharacterized protein n=1 Tax=Streptomyces tsukubensis (strain DSM 42081 / NBRC 108919 / NRRL 18488 / 9993) TaxID=1114943 RepID=I2NBG0_STRT9|nr:MULTISPECIES: hypothetical protein [Streptomyces]AZK98065.1 hypothetical protein B7R87_32380 [Streptomyces tsukubensis]EIF94357.1 hypothetical protein [Streptomyces tsukubensis NRRL18488]MYS68118.1 hypothetical protein [Streptomyces sp. SID5473]QKM66010.1 hypothetical protein STSU_001380 [Streptomyces tsukubensis NRRL18488]TAI42290.1 hypothetical protein EWI31_22120 [Streptomyces tsukubensis]